MVDTSYGKYICQECGIVYPRCFLEEDKRRWNHRQFCPECRDKCKKPPTISKISDEEFALAVKESVCVREVLLRLNLKAAGGNYACFHERVKRLGLDTSHFTGGAHMAGKNFGPKRPIEDYLQNKFKISSSKLKARLIKEGIKKHQCESCSLDWWIDQQIPLELHHINGDHFDNQLENLQFLCPNCHAGTENYRGRAQERTKNKEIREIPVFLYKDKETILEQKRQAKELKAKRKEKEKSVKAPYIPITKINWPSDLDLLDYIWNHSVSKFARENGVVDHSVINRCKRRCMPTPPVGFFRRKQVGKDVSAEWQVYLEFREKMVASVGPAPTLKQV